MTAKITSDQRQTRAVFAPSTINEAERTVDIIWTTGAEGERCEWDGEVYLESLRVDDTSVRMGRLNNGAPFLNAHQNTNGLSDQIGVVERAWILDGLGYATIRFSSRTDVEPFFTDIKNGIIRNISVGYIVYKYERVAGQDGAPDRLIAVDWEPMEISAVCTPFDAGAQVRGGALPRTFTAEVINRTKGSLPMKRKLKVIRAALVTARATLIKAREVADEAAVAEAQTALESIEAELEDALDTLDEGLGAVDPVDPPADPATPVTASAEEIAAEQRGMQAERVRTASIRQLAVAFPNSGVDLEALVARGVNFQTAQMAVLTAVAQRQALGVTNIQNGAPVDHTRALDAMGVAIMYRARPTREALTGEAARFRGDSLMDMGRRCIEMAGGRSEGLSRREIAQLSLNIGSAGLRRTAGMMSTSDFPLILGNTIDRSLRAAYAETEPTWMPLGRQDDVNDFRQRTIVALGDTAAFEKVLEGGEYKYGTLPEEGNTYKVDKYGKIIPFTWEAMVNDDLGAFNRLPAALAAGARQTESNIVWSLLLSNPNWIDGQPMYSAAHGNIAAAAGAITVASLGAARAAMRKQKGINGQNFINIVPKYLVVGPDRELEAQQFLSPNYTPVTSQTINPFVNTLTLIVEPRITDGSWYVVGDGADTFVYSYLAGEGGLFTETREGFEVDGVEVKGRLIFGAAYVDYRSLYKNAGA